MQVHLNRSSAQAYLYFGGTAKACRLPGWGELPTQNNKDIKKQSVSGGWFSAPRVHAMWQ